MVPGEPIARCPAGSASSETASAPANRPEPLPSVFRDPAFDLADGGEGTRRDAGLLLRGVRPTRVSRRVQSSAKGTLGPQGRTRMPFPSRPTAAALACLAWLPSYRPAAAQSPPAAPATTPARRRRPRRLLGSGRTRNGHVAPSTCGRTTPGPASGASSTRRCRSPWKTPSGRRRRLHRRSRAGGPPWHPTAASDPNSRASSVPVVSRREGS
jgi:hypothetical protein